MSLSGWYKATNLCQTDRIVTVRARGFGLVDGGELVGVDKDGLRRDVRHRYSVHANEWSWPLEPGEVIVAANLRLARSVECVDIDTRAKQADQDRKEGERR